jgi:pyruvate,water dikinase
VDAAPANRRTPEAITDPAVIMLWGVTTQRVQEWARARRRRRADRRGGARRARRGARARRDHVDETRRRARRRRPRLPDHLARLGADLPEDHGVVTDIGGVMSHAAIVCREYGLPAVVGTGRATAEIRTGQMIRVDGSTGVVTILDVD